MKKLNEIKKVLCNKFGIFCVQDFEYYYNSGIDAYNRQDYGNALDFFKLALEQKNIKPQVYYNIALTNQCIKEYDRAIANYNNFLELVPNDYEGLYNLALTYYFQEIYHKAIEFFEKCTEIKKDKETVKFLILSYINNDESQKALDFAESSLGTEPNGLEIYFDTAKIFSSKNYFSKDFTSIDTAIDMYKRVLEMNTRHFESYLEISICYAKKGQWQESVEFCKKAIAENPKSYEANNQMGLVFYCKNEIKEAIKYYEQAFKHRPKNDFKIYSNLAYAYEKIGKYDKAIEIFTQLVKKAPDFPAKEEIKHHMKILKKI